MNNTGHDSHAHHHEHVVVNAASSTPLPTLNEHAHHHEHAAASPIAGQQHEHIHAMKMWFHGGYDEVILFDWWRISSLSGLLFSIVMVFAMGVLYEGVKWLRVYLETLVASRRLKTIPGVALSSLSERVPLDKAAAEQHAAADGVATLRSDEVYRSTVTRDTGPRYHGALSRLFNRLNIDSSSSFSGFRLIQTSLYILQLTLAYWLMLIAMTYNTYLTAAVILGAGFGHWIFAVLKPNSTTNDQVNAFASDVCH